MYSILINKKDYSAKTLEVTVFVFQYDIENKTHAPLPEHKTFFLDFLIRCHSNENNYIKQISENSNNKNTEAFLAKNVDIFIHSIKQTSTKNFPFEKWQKKYHQKSKIAEKDLPQIVQATYTIEVVDELYMEHVYEGFYYSSDYRDIAPINNDIDSSILPNTTNSLQDIYDLLSDYHDKPINIKISNNSAYIFLSYNENNFAVIDTNTWSIKWETTIQDAYNIIHEDSAQGIVWLQDYNEIVEAFDIQTGNKVQYNRHVDYFLSPSLNLSTYWDENTPIEIKDKDENIVCTIALKNNTFYTLAFSNNDKFIALGYDKSIDIWNIENQVLVQSISFEKGVLHKLIFGHDSSLIYALANDIIYGISLITSNIVFKHNTSEDYSISNFDINNNLYSIIEIATEKRSYLSTKGKIYTLGCQEFSIDNKQVKALKEKAEAKRAQENRWAELILTFPYVKETAKFIDSLKEDFNAKYKWINLGHYLIVIEAYQDAINSTAVALEMRPHDDLAHYNMGTIYMLLKDYDNAIFHLKKALKSSPSNTRPYGNLASCLFKRGDFDEGINTLIKFADKSNDPTIYTTISMKYLKKKELEKAQEAANTGVKRRCLDECSMNLAHTYYLQNDIETARKHYKISFYNFKNKDQFFEDMIGDYDVLSLYNITQDTWYTFVEEFRTLLVKK